MPTSYLPTGDVNLASWYANFSNKMNTLHGATLGFTAAELSDIQNDNTAFQNAVQYKENLRMAAVGMTGFVKALKSTSVQGAVGNIPVVPAMLPLPASVLTGIFNRLAMYVRRIKSHSNYTYTIGQDLGIIVPAAVFDPNTIKPVLTVKLSGGYPVIRYRKGKAHGIYLYVDRRDNNGFVLLDKFNSVEYIDVHPLPANTVTATWDYKAKFMIDDEEVGLYSEIVTVNVVRV